MGSARDCPGCGAEAEDEMVFCTHCGTRLPEHSLVLEVRLPQQVTSGACGLIDFRIRNDSDASVGDVEVSVESSLALKENLIQKPSIEPGQEALFHRSFEDVQHGEHHFVVEIRTKERRLVGRLPLQVSPARSGSRVINYTDARSFDGRIIVGTEGAQLSVVESDGNPAPDVTSDFVVVALRPPQQNQSVVRKSAFRGMPAELYRNHRIGLTFRVGEHSRIFGLIAGDIARLGRSRTASVNDVVLRVLPPTQENREQSQLISGNHAEVRLTENGAVWKNENCGGGTRVNDRNLEANQSCRIGQHDLISASGVLPLRMRTVRSIPVANLGSYSDFCEVASLMPPLSSPGPCHALCMEREDDLPANEVYILMQGICSIGSARENALVVDSNDMAMVHAVVLWLGGSFWLEPLQASKPTFRDGVTVDLDQLVPLVPGETIHFGRLEMAVHEFRQQYVDG